MGQFIMAGMDYYASADQSDALDQVADVAETGQIAVKKPEINRQIDGGRMNAYIMEGTGHLQVKALKASPG